MSTTRPTPKSAVRTIVRRTRLFRVDEHALCYEPLCGLSAEALRKTCERMRDDGELLTSAMPKGAQVFRGSAKTVAELGAPRSFANAPTATIVIESLAAFSLAHDTERFVFLTKFELEAQFRKRGFVKPVAPNNRFLLKKSGGHVVRLDFFVAEALSADALLKRLSNVAVKLRQHPAIADIDAAGLFGATVAVASDGARQTLLGLALPSLPIEIVVVDSLREFITHAA